jgi:hypothetical protein
MWCPKCSLFFTLPVSEAIKGAPVVSLVEPEEVLPAHSPQSRQSAEPTWGAGGQRRPILPAGATPEALPADKSPRKKVLPPWAWILILIVGSIIFARVVSSLSQHGSTGPIAVQATTLHREYRADPFAADKRYLGEVLMVTGTVELVEFENDHSCVCLVGCEPGGMFNQVRCFFGRGEDVSGLSRGQEIVIYGKCVSQTFVGANVFLEGCHLVSRPH